MQNNVPIVKRGRNSQLPSVSPYLLNNRLTIDTMPVGAISPQFIYPSELTNRLDINSIFTPSVKAAEAPQGTLTYDMNGNPIYLEDIKQPPSQVAQPAESAQRVTTNNYIQPLQGYTEYNDFSNNEFYPQTSTLEVPNVENVESDTNTLPETSQQTITPQVSDVERNTGTGMSALVQNAKDSVNKMNQDYYQYQQDLIEADKQAQLQAINSRYAIRDNEPFGYAKNANSDLKEIGTGLALGGTLGMATAKATIPMLQPLLTEDDKALLNLVQDEAFKYFMYTPAEKKVGDLYNLGFGNLISAEQIKGLYNKKATPQEVGQAILDNAYEKPLGFILDALSTGALVAKPASMVAKGVGAGLKSLSNVKGISSIVKKTASAKMANEIMKAGAKVNAGDIKNASDAAVDAVVARAITSSRFSEIEAKLKESVSGLTIEELAKVLKSAEEGINLPKKLLKAKKTLREFSDLWDDMLKEWFPYTHENPDIMAITQYVTRKTGQPFSELKKIVVAALDADKTIMRYELPTMNEVIRAIKSHGIKVVRKTPNTFTKEGLLEWKTQKGHYSHRDNTIYLAPDAKVGTVLHELFHALTFTTLKKKAKSLADFERAADIVGEVGEGIKPIADLPAEIIDMLPFKKISSLDELAQFDDLYKVIKDGKKLYDEGKIFQITHSNIETAEKIKDIINSVDDAVYAGIGSTRMLGTATYDNIAKAYKDFKKMLQSMENLSTEKEAIKKVVEEGIPNAKPQDVRYVSPKDLEDANSVAQLSAKAANKVTKTADTDIPINIKYLNKMEDSIGLIKGTNPFERGSLLSDMWEMTRANLLAGGTYIAGNIQTGLSNMLLNSNIFAPADIFNAIKSGRRLSKELGLHRRMIRNTNRVKNPALRLIQQANLPLSDALNAIDINSQNLFAEIATHANLREKGIPYAQRVAQLRKYANTDKKALANIIDDVSNVALIQGAKTIVPKSARGLVSISSGHFWRWYEQALKSTAHMFKKRPILSNLIYNHLLGDIAYNTEMQHRLNINAELDNPHVHMKWDNNGQLRNIRVDISPLATSAKFGTNVIDMFTGSKKAAKELFPTASMPIATLAATMGGVDKYGRPLKRANVTGNNRMLVGYYSNQRYTTDDNGNLVKMGTQADEVLSTAVTNFLSVYPNFINRTIAPTYGLITGNTYYQPYAQSIFGSYDPSQDLGILSTGNPMNAVTPDQAFNRLFGIYESPYYDEDKDLGGKDIKRIRRSNLNYDRRYQHLLRNLGGQE